MAIAESGWSTIQNQRRIKVYLDGCEISSSTDTTVTYKITAHVYCDHAAQYGVGLRLCLQDEGWYGTDATWVLSQGASGCYATHYSTVSRGSSAYSRTVYAQLLRMEVDGYGAWSGPYVEATSSVTVPHRTWYQPRPPKAFAASRTSDTAQRLTWEGDYTGLDGGYPWSGVYVERATDDGAWKRIATLGWSATNYDDASTESGHRYRYRAQAYNSTGNSAYTDEVELFTTPAACTGVTATKPTGSTVRLDCATRPAYADSYEFQASTDGGRTWAAATFEDWVCADPPKGTVTFRVRALKSSGGAGPVDLAAPWAESNQVATLCAPLVPLVGVPDVVATGTALTIAWTPNHPDATAQTKAQVEVTDQAGATTTTDVAGAATTLVRPAASQATAGSIRIRVRTHGEYDAWGEWSSYAVVRVAVAPKVAFSAPTAGMTLAALPLSVEWTVTDETGVSEQSLSISDPSGATVWSSTPGNGVRSLTVGSEAGFLNSTGYTLTYSMRAGSGLTLTKTVAFATEWASPDAPGVSITFDSSLAAHVRVTAAATGIAAVSFDVARVSGDGRLQLGTGLESGHEVIDRLAPLNVAYSYEVTAHAATGATLVTTTTVTDQVGAMALNFGRDAGECWLGLYDPGHSKDVSHDATAVHLFNGNDLPEVYTTGERDVTRSYSFSVGESDFKRLDAMCDAHPYGWVREHDGERAFGIVSVSSSRTSPGWRSVSLKFTDCSWREPNVG